MDCSAQFHEATQGTKMEMHCLVMGAYTSHGGQHYLHHGFQWGSSQAGTNVYRIVSDAVDSIKRWEQDNDY